GVASRRPRLRAPRSRDIMRPRHITTLRRESSMRTRKSNRDSGPTLELRPSAITHGDLLQIAGAGWPLDAIMLSIGHSERFPDRVLVGSIWERQLVPAADGTFLVELSTDTMQ